MPKHEHDCEHCAFLGTFLGVDHYVCRGSGDAEYVQRFSSDGPDYRAISGQDLPLMPADVRKRWTLTVELAQT